MQGTFVEPTIESSSYYLPTASSFSGMLFDMTELPAVSYKYGSMVNLTAKSLLETVTFTLSYYIIGNKNYTLMEPNFLSCVHNSPPLLHWFTYPCPEGCQSSAHHSTLFLRTVLILSFRSNNIKIIISFSC